MPGSVKAGDLLADRYQLTDLLSESQGGRFWRAHDIVLNRPVAIHLLAADDPRAAALIAAARRSALVPDRRNLRVLDLDDGLGAPATVATGSAESGPVVFVANEWGQGVSLDRMLATEGPLQPRRAAWLVAEVGDALAHGHAQGVAHGRLVPENVLIDHNGQVRIIGMATDAALHGIDSPNLETDVEDLAGLLYAALTGKWAGPSLSVVPPAPHDHGGILRPRQVRAGIPRSLDQLCDAVLNQRTTPQATWSARLLSEELADFVGDSTGFAADAAQVAVRHANLGLPEPISLPPEPHQAVGSHREGQRSSLEPEPSSGQEPTPEAQVGAAVAAANAAAAAATDRMTEALAAQRRAMKARSEELADRRTGELVDEPTQAGMPVFEDDGAVGWIAKRAERPKPPPPLKPVVHKPLFAPDPPAGEPVRRPRSDVVLPPTVISITEEGASRSSGDRSGPASSFSGAEGQGFSTTGSQSYWPWPHESFGSGEGMFSDSSAAVLGVPHDGDRVPGRGWLRVGVVVAVLALLGLTALAGFQLGWFGDRSNPAQSTPRGPTTVPLPSPRVLTGKTGLTGSDFDPMGDGAEMPQLVAAAFDGDPTTSWRTLTYKQNFGPGGLKAGVGLFIDLGGLVRVREVKAGVEGVTGAQLFLMTTQESTLDGLQPVAESTSTPATAGPGELLLTPAEPTEARYAVIWLTSLPSVPGGFRAEISEVEVKG